MKNYNLIQYPNQLLRKKSHDVLDFEGFQQYILPRMKEILKESKGIGISAIQIGCQLNAMIVSMCYDQIDLDKEPSLDNYLVICNPIIKNKSKVVVSELEGCLSLKDQYIDIKRPDWIEVEYYDQAGTKHEIKLEKFIARIFLHEYDHFHGILMNDYYSCRESALTIIRSLCNDEYGLFEIEFSSFSSLMNKTLTNYIKSTMVSKDNYKINIDMLKMGLDMQLFVKVMEGKNEVPISRN